jgi:phosphoglycolate phosphatase-like HAD superfamily hydrolase
MIKLKDMISRGLFLESKKLRVFDFDDTLVKTNSFIYVTHGDGRKSKLTPGQYAVYNEKPDDEMDYSDFQNVKEPTEIKKITSVLRRIMKSSGGDGVYILTARSVYKPIKQYLKDIGVNSNKIYVVALASADPKDKSNWIADKIDNEGYDDVYFADDSEKNVKSVKNMLRGKDVKWRVQLIKEHKSYKN